MKRNSFSSSSGRRARPLLGLMAVVVAFSVVAFASMSRKASAVREGDPPQTMQAVFTNATPITINDAATATPYPSAIVVSGLGTSIPATAGSVKVTLNSYSHTFSDDVGMVLVGPTGAALLLQDGAGDDPDMVNITYTLSDTGATVLPGTTAWAAGTYKPTTYYINDSFPAPGPGTAYGSPGPTGGGTATFASVYTGTNPNGTWNLFVVDFVGGDAGSISGGWSIEITTGSPPLFPQHVIDYDGDAKTDPSVARNTGGGPGGQLTWFNKPSNGVPSSTSTPWGLQGDEFTPEDFDGDLKTDIAVWRSGPPFGAYFYILQSSTGTLRIDQFGQTNDDPSVVGDYDGDGKADPAVYRGGAAAGDHSNWYYRSSVNGLIIGTEWGQNGDFSVPGDFDNDGKNDFVVQRNNGGGQARFFVRLATGATSSFVYGTPTDVILPGDYDGDGKTDIATVRGSGGNIFWNVLRSSDGISVGLLYGVSATDFPTPGDWDGDGKTDISVWRPNADPTLNFYFWRRSSDGVDASTEWGQNGDYPVANFNNH